MKLEADGFCTALVESPKGHPERFAFVMEHEETNLKLYFFVTREMVHDIVSDLVEQVGHDA